MSERLMPNELSAMDEMARDDANEGANEGDESFEFAAPAAEDRAPPTPRASAAASPRIETERTRVRARVAPQPSRGAPRWGTPSRSGTNPARCVSSRRRWASPPAASSSPTKTRCDASLGARRGARWRVAATTERQRSTSGSCPRRVGGRHTGGGTRGAWRGTERGGGCSAEDGTAPWSPSRWRSRRTRGEARSVRGDEGVFIRHRARRVWRRVARCAVAARRVERRDGECSNTKVRCDGMMCLLFASLLRASNPGGSRAGRRGGKAHCARSQRRVSRARRPAGS